MILTPCDAQGNIFSITLVRNAKMEVMRKFEVDISLLAEAHADMILAGCLVHGYQTAKTNSAKKAFPLEEMKKWARAVLDDKIPAAYWQRSMPLPGG